MKGRQMAKEHDTRRREIIDTARTLFFTHGYDNCTVADIIREVGIAKGTFYHYFVGKEQLLTELIEEFAEEIFRQINGIATDTSRSVVDRLSAYFQQSMVVKAQSPELMLAAIQMLYRRENTLLRVQMVDETVNRVAPVLGTLIREGSDQGVFDVADPDLCGRYLISSFSALSQRIGHLILTHPKKETLGTEVHRIFDFMEWSVARLLGVEVGVITLADRDAVDALFRTLAERANAPEASDAPANHPINGGPQ
jgi:AcrR family transcriptional regulator